MTAIEIAVDRAREALNRLDYFARRDNYLLPSSHHDRLVQSIHKALDLLATKDKP